MKSKECRRLVGRLDQNMDVYSGLKQVCKSHEVLTGDIRAIGYLMDARLAVYDPESATFIEDEESMGPVQVLNLTGNVSQRRDEFSLHLQTTLQPLGPSPGPVRGGRLLSGTVADLEFTIESVDDFTFLRVYDENTGLYPWLNIIPTNPEEHDDEIMDRSEFLPGRLGSRVTDDEPDYELHPDDTLEHPRLGTCTVVQVPDEDRASIRLESGRTVELHLGLLKLQRTAKAPGGHQTFRVAVRKRS